MTKIDPRLIDVFPSQHDGYPSELAAMDTPAAMRESFGDAARDFPNSLWVEPRDWADVAAENDRLGLWPENYRIRRTNQSPTHECTCHALVQCMEIAWNRQQRLKLSGGEDFRSVQGHGMPVYFSALSIYAEANPRIRGGANLQTVIGIAVRRGFIPDKIQPQTGYRFQHSLTGTNGRGNAQQSAGDWVATKNFPSGWEQTARHFRPIEVINPESYEQIVSLVLNGICVAVGRSGHSIPYVRWHPGEKAMEYSDSYDVARYDSLATVKRAVGGAYAIVSTTVPDDWRKPGG